MKPNLGSLRQYVNTTLTCEGQVTVPGEPVWDDTTGTYIPGPPVVIWSGRCLVWSRALDGHTADAGQTTWQVDQYVVTFPAGTDVAKDQTLTVTASPDEPDMTTFDLTLTDVPIEAWSVALQCLAVRVSP